MAGGGLSVLKTKLILNSMPVALVENSIRDLVCFGKPWTTPASKGWRISATVVCLELLCRRLDLRMRFRCLAVCLESAYQRSVAFGGFAQAGALNIRVAIF